MEGLKEYTKEELQEYSKEELIDWLIDAIWIIKKLDQLLLEKKDELKYRKRVKNYYNAIVDYYQTEKNKRSPEPEDFWLYSDSDHKLRPIEDSRD